MSDRPDAATGQAGAAIWRAVAAGRPAGALDATAVARFCQFASPAFAALLLGAPAIDPVALEQSRLANRFADATHRHWLALVLAAGIDVLAIKGFALAYQLYDDPPARAVGDLDLLVRAGDRDRLIALLGAAGFTFRALPTPPWGFISTASYMPYVSADGACNVDIHVHPDCYPAYRSLTTERVFADAVALHAGEMAFRAPSPGHAFLLCATNAAKDKFGPFAARKLVDAMVLARAGGLIGRAWPASPTPAVTVCRTACLSNYCVGWVSPRRRCRATPIGHCPLICAASSTAWSRKPWRSIRRRRVWRAHCGASSACAPSRRSACTMPRCGCVACCGRVPACRLRPAIRRRLDARTRRGDSPAAR